MLVADFCAAAVLISFGAVLGKASMSQLIIIAVLIDYFKMKINFKVKLNKIFIDCWSSCSKCQWTYRPSHFSCKTKKHIVTLIFRNSTLSQTAPKFNEIKRTVQIVDEYYRNRTSANWNQFSLNSQFITFNSNLWVINRIFGNPEIWLKRKKFVKNPKSNRILEFLSFRNLIYLFGFLNL